MSKTDELAKIIGISSNIVFFGGAGMSTESGIPDFRSADGIYNQKLNKRFSPEKMLSHTFLMSHPEEFFEFLFNKMIFWKQHLIKDIRRWLNWKTGGSCRLL